MAIGSTNTSMNNKLEDEIKSIQNPEFTEATSRENINSKENITKIFGKIKKYLTDLKPHAFNTPKNNLTTTSTGYALDAYQGKVLNDAITKGLRSLITVKTYTHRTTSQIPSGGGYTANFNVALDGFNPVTMIIHDTGHNSLTNNYSWLSTTNNTVRVDVTNLGVNTLPINLSITIDVLYIKNI